MDKALLNNLFTAIFRKIKTIPVYMKLLRKMSRLTLVLSIVTGALIIALLQHFVDFKSLFRSSEFSDYFGVYSVSPENYTANLKQPIVITFNKPVEAHHVQEYIVITPNLEGEFRQINPTQIAFDPKKSYIPGSRIKILLKKGLPTEKGKKLLSDYNFSFSISTESRLITFKNDDGREAIAKFMSFSSSKGTNMSISMSYQVDKPTIKIFKVDKQTFLNSLIYSIPEEYKSQSSYDYGIYLEKPVDTTKLELVEERSIKDGDKINFKNKKGLYLIQGLENGEVVNTAWIALNDIGIHLRQDDQKIFMAAQDMRTGNPVDDVQIELYNLWDKPQLQGKYTLNSLQEYPYAYPKRLDLVVASKGDDIMVIPVALPNSQAEIKVSADLSKKQEIFIYTDRPIYKPGDTVYFRGIARIDNDGIYQLPAKNTKIRVRLSQNYSEKGQAFDQVINLSDSGNFSGEFTLSKVLPTKSPYSDSQTSMALYATSEIESKDYYSPSSAFFDVVDYIKPEFGLDLTSSASELVRGDKINTEVFGYFFDGKPLSGEQVSYSIYKKDFYETEKAVYSSSFNLNNWGGMCGGGFGFSDEYYGDIAEGPKTITLNENGKAQISFNTQNIRSNISQEITILIEKKDKNGNKIVSAKNIIVHNGEFNIFFLPSKNDSAENGERFTASAYVERLDGTKMENATLVYKIVEENYNPTSLYNEKFVLKSAANTITNSEGILTIDDIFKVKIAKGAYLEVSAKDSRGNNIEARKYIYFYPKGADSQQNYYSAEKTVLKISSLVSNLTPGKQATLNIDSPADIKVFLTYERGRVYNPRWLDLKKGNNILTFDVPDVFMPSITPTFSFFYNGDYHIEGLSLNVPAMKKLINVSISTNKSKYTPSDSAEVTITTTDQNGNPISTDIGIGVVDKAIFALRKSAAQPIHSSFYYFRPRSTNASSSLTWVSGYGLGGRGGGGPGGGSASKEVDTLYWNPTLKTDESGKLTINIPLGKSETTWRIMAYASTSDSRFGQGELDFLVVK